MSKSFDEIMKVLEEKGEIPDEAAKKIIEEHGDLTDEEKKQVAATLRMNKALKKKDDASKDGKEGDGEDDEVSLDAYLQALATLDSDDASKDEKDKAEKVKAAFESQ